MELILSFVEGDGDYEWSLECPTCGMEQTHLQRVVCYERPGGEDRPTTALTGTVGSDQVGVEQVGDDENPSSRRDAQP